MAPSPFDLLSAHSLNWVHGAGKIQISSIVNGISGVISISSMSSVVVHTWLQVYSSSQCFQRGMKVNIENFACLVEIPATIIKMKSVRKLIF